MFGAQGCQGRLPPLASRLNVRCVGFGRLQVLRGNASELASCRDGHRRAPDAGCDQQTHALTFGLIESLVLQA